RSDLDPEAMSRRSKTNGKADWMNVAHLDWAGPIGGIIEGTNFHESTRDLAASFIATGISPNATTGLLKLMQASQHQRDERWEARYADVERTVQSAYEKFGQSQ